MSRRKPAPVCRLAAAATAAAILLPGCFLAGPDYAAPTATDLGVPAAWHATAPAHDDGLAIADWWQQLDDPQLTDLVRRALAASPDLAAAQARLREARARRRVAGAGLWPTLGASASAQHLKLSEGSLVGGSGGFAGIQDFDSTREFFDAGFDASWEPDVFGGQRRAREAAAADVAAAAANLDETRITLAAEVARNYVELRSGQARVAIGEANLASQSETLSLTEWRVQAGLATSLDAEQARTAVEQTRAAIPLVETARAEALHRLATLLGAAPGALAAELAAPAPIPQIPEPLTVGIPADILRQRPDVAAAERAVAAATARVGEATAARYPNLTLSGTFGVQAMTVAALTNGSSVAASAVGRLAQTIFDGGRIRAQIEIQDAVREEALAAYRTTVLAAVEEVENALVALAGSRTRAAALGRGVDSARNAALLARHQYAAGLADFQTVLDTERTVLAVEESLVAAEAGSTTAVVRLYKALGGGWSATAPDTAGTAQEPVS